MENLAQDLRDLMSVAISLRRLAEDSPLESDSDLYLTTAAALEARAHWRATAMPDDVYDETAPVPRGHVDMVA